MTKIIKCVMFTRLYDLFPQVKDLKKSGYPVKLIIEVTGTDKTDDGKDKFYWFSLEIESASKDREEPYTQETLEKAIIEFPQLFKDRLDRYFDRI
jgi:hypothetical protein